MVLDLKTPRVTLGVFFALCIYLFFFSGFVAFWWPHTIQGQTFSLRNMTMYQNDSKSSSHNTVLPTTLKQTVTVTPTIPGPRTTKVAIGLAITSKGLPDRQRAETVAKLQVFRTLLPSFCKTASFNGKYRYGFYIAYDKPDIMFIRPENRDVFQGIFDQIINSTCGPGVRVKLTFIQCDYTAKPARSQNDAMMRAYLDDNDYYYRINDDTDMQSQNWTEYMIAQLNKYKPPNLGVVGPAHSGGNTKILTYDFVHKTHIEAFGFYYPRVFKDLYGDSWISEVYGPSRTTKMPQIKLKHTQAAGKRYNERAKGGGGPARKYLPRELQRDRELLRRYAKHMSDVAKGKKLDSNSRHVVSMAVTGASIHSVYGAVRNAILVKMFFTGWRLRVYGIVQDRAEAPPDMPDYYVNTHGVPDYVIQRLRSLGAEFMPITDVEFVTTVPSDRYWNYLVTEDKNVDAFLLRPVASRLDQRDSVLASYWLEKKSAQYPFYYVQDAIAHMKERQIFTSRPAKLTFRDYLLGGSLSTLRTNKISLDFRDSLVRHFRNKKEDHSTEAHFSAAMWKAIDAKTFSFVNSVSMSERLQQFPIRLAKENLSDSVLEIGREYDAFQTLDQ